MDVLANQTESLPTDTFSTQLHAHNSPFEQLPPPFERYNSSKEFNSKNDSDLNNDSEFKKYINLKSNNKNQHPKLNQDSKTYRHSKSDQFQNSDRNSNNENDVNDILSEEICRRGIEAASIRVSIAVAVSGMIIVGFFFVHIFLFTVVADRLTRRVRLMAFENILRQNIGYFDVNFAGELNTRLTQLVVRVGDWVAMLRMRIIVEVG